jgi:hypothetical protein
LPHYCWARSVLFGVAIAGMTRIDPVLTHTPEQAGNGSSSPGRGLFFGETPLHGIISGHNLPLPPKMVSCANCHLQGWLPASGVSNSAPRLDRSSLTEFRRRRGGPLSQFTPATFCRLLRTGVDPAYILITRRMPRYTIEDRQCLYLWQYLMEQRDAPDGQ